MCRQRALQRAVITGLRYRDQILHLQLALLGIRQSNLHGEEVRPYSHTFIDEILYGSLMFSETLHTAVSDF